MSTLVPDQATDAASDVAAFRLRRVQEAAARLAFGSLREIVEATPQALCEACAFDRAMMSHVRGDRVAFAAGANLHEPARAEQFREMARTVRARLVDAPPELEALTTQLPVIARGADEPEAAVHFAASKCLGTSEYVVAPIVHGGRVVGLLHADRYASGERIGALDAELVFVFATGVGAALRDAAVAQMYAGESTLSLTPGDFIEARLASFVHELADVPGGWARESAAPDDDALAELTPREREVLVLLASGASNQAIAETLVVSEPTIKSHVRGVLRKLGAANRTEAVSRYHALTR